MIIHYCWLLRMFRHCVTNLSGLFILKMYQTAARPFCSQCDKFISLSSIQTCSTLWTASVNGTFGFYSKHWTPLLKSCFLFCSNTCVLLYMSIKLFLLNPILSDILNHFLHTFYLSAFFSPLLWTFSGLRIWSWHVKFCCFIIYLNKITLVHTWREKKMYFFHQPSKRF